MSLIIKYFSITKALSDAINHYFKNLKVLLPITGIVGLLVLFIVWAFIPGFQIPYFKAESILYRMRNAQSYYSHINTNIGSEHYIGLILLSIYKAFLISFGFKICNNDDQKNLDFKEITFSRAQEGISSFGTLDFQMSSYLVARLRYTLSCITGLILGVIPGIIWIPRYYFANYFVIDRKLSVGESFVASSQLTYGIKSKLWLFMIIKSFMFYILIVGFSPLPAILMYVMVYLPISVFAKISIYKQLLAPKHIS